MDKANQKEAFLQYEADNYFRRNKDVKYSAEQDVVIRVLQGYNVQPRSVLEIGCNSGYRLNGIYNSFDGVKVSGIEPSTEAIQKGTSDHPHIKFVKGTADNLNAFGSASFDLIIIGFVLYVVDREMLLQVVAETDRVLADGGLLMIIDFFSQKPSRNQYKHISEIEAYAFKQNYEEIFLATKLYHLMDKRTMDHTSKHYDLSDDYYNKYALTTLRKDLTAGYK